jgi:UrcA family protein
MIKIRTALGAGALAAAALCTPAAANPTEETANPTEETKVVVSYAGLDLANPADAARLDRRLKAAARTICGDAPLLDLGLAAKAESCRADAMARARADLRIAMRSGGNRVVALRTN